MSDFRIKTCVLGMVSTNCYIIYKETIKEAVIVDPADNGMYILNKCRELGVTPVAVLLTHGHCDHIMAVEDIRRSFHVTVYVGMNEEKLLKDPYENLSGSFGTEQTSLEADYLLRDKEEIQLAGFRIKVLETPGHTSGSVCYLFEEEDVLISGDTLFENSLGRTDLPTGSSSDIIKSISERLFALKDDIMVYPGHGEPTTIGYEKKYNPVAAYLRRR